MQLVYGRSVATFLPTLKFGTSFQIHFHPVYPDHVFSCSENGNVWHWDGDAAKKINFGNQFGISKQCISNKEIFKKILKTVLLLLTNVTDSSFLITENIMDDSPWFGNEALKNKVETHSLMPTQSLPVNSIDVMGSTVLVGGDNEAFYIFYNVLL